MKQKILLLLFSGFLCVATLHAQKEANNWLFGNRAGLTWNTTQSLTATGLFGTPNKILDKLPDVLNGSSMNTYEGCFSLSDRNGNLLFYSNGMTIWKANHQPMNNGSGLFGHDSSAQSGIVIPNPANPRQYYAISLGDWLSNNLAYSIVDMDLDSGSGDIVAGEKNKLFSGASGITGESVTAIKHANGIDYWVVAPGRGNPAYLNAWLATASGVASTPVTTISPVAETTGYNTGYIKFDSTGEYFAWPTGYGNKIIFGKFDVGTGQFSNLKYIPFALAYGCEFSPSSEYLYIGGCDGNRNLRVYKFMDLIASDSPATVPYKEYTFPAQQTAFQLSPDGRIYIGINNARYLYIIDNPEEYDNLRIYQLPNNFLGDIGISRYGLPSFSASWWSAPIKGNTIFCIKTSQAFSMNITKGSGGFELDHTEWDFGDGTILVDNSFVNNEQRHSHTYTEPGNYTITVRAILKYDGSELMSARQTLNVKASRCVMPVNHNISVMGY